MSVNYFENQNSIGIDPLKKWPHSDSFISMCPFLIYRDLEPVRIFVVNIVCFATRQISAKEMFVSWNQHVYEVSTITDERKFSLSIDSIE